MAGIFFCAGEASGDGHSATVAAALRRLAGEVELFGFGGARMAAAGVRLQEDLAARSVMGVLPVLKELPYFVGLMRRAEALLDRRRPDAVFLCDYPGFNLRLAAKAKARGIPVLYFVSPQLWAWWPSRVRRVARVVDHMLVLFPFEQAFYRDAGVPCTFVGHPIGEYLSAPPDPARLRGELGLARDHRLVALFPGSRRHEIEALLEVMLAAAARIVERRPNTRLALGMSSMSVDRRPAVDALVEQAIARQGIPVTVLRSRTHELMGACDAAFTCSGTATLELAALDAPMVVLYRIRPWQRLLAHGLLHTEHIAMPNILAGRTLAPEYLFGHPRPERYARALESLLDDGASRRALLWGYREIRRAVFEPWSAERVALLVLRHMRY